MFKKKLMAVAAAVASFALVIPAFSLSATAANGDIIDVGGKSVKLVTDFNSFNDGMRVGKNSDKIFTAAANTDTQGYNFTIKDGIGADGSKALSFGVVKGVLGSDPSQNCQSATYNLKKGNSATDYSGDTDFVFWIDCTKNASEKMNMQVIIFEWDYDQDGNPVMDGDANKVIPKGFHNSTYYTLADGASGWTENDTTDGSYSLSFPNTFKGYVRVPVDQFIDYWGITSSDGAFNLKHIESIGFYYYFSNKDEANDYAYAVDNVGFAGDYTVPTTTTETTTVTTGSTTESTTGSKTVSTDTTTGKDTAATTLNTDTTAAPTAEITTAAPADTTTAAAEESPKTGDKPIAAALAVAVAFAGVLIAAKKKNAF